MEESTVVAMHLENRKDVIEVKGKLANVQAEQAIAAVLQRSNSEKIERMSEILEGDGNGNPGLVRKFDAVIAQINSLTKTRDDVVDWLKKSRVVLWRSFKWALPFIVAWIVSWFSIPPLREFVRHFTIGN